MLNKKILCTVLAAVLTVLFPSCQKVDEAAPEQIYYIEASERLYIPEEIAEADAETGTSETVPETEDITETVSETAETVSETAETTETTASETETETETEAATETSAETTSETFTETETETYTETEPQTEIITETLPVTEITVSETQPAEAAELYEASYPAESSYVKPLGRTFMRDGARILSHTCSGVEFAFRGTVADVTLTSNCKTSKARAAFYVNGELVKETMLEKEEETFRVFESEKSENCIISVVKLSEAAYSNIGVKSIHVASEYGIIPTPARSRKIEFIGDSITCGYGVDAADQYEAFATTNENGEKTYAALVGKHFKADYNVISWSGIGVYSSYTESSKPNQSFLLPPIYGKTAPNELANDMWDFSQWQPDVVVINLGTNDNTWTRGIQERVDLFGDAYYKFIEQVREANPNAYIICSLGVMGSKLLPEIKEQVALYSSNTGDYRITAFEFDYRDGVNDGFGAGFHPSAVTHQKMADKLIPFISQLMGW
ncbi:MAG: GDSL-type esterase/lipase family protein [Prevotella sp.]|nr:GDSL-type esterase/lipase family protein [Prevotella sp.]